ncbi:MAG: DegT/DnrJ/EryC1/StrS family aminotransferase [candidate division WOR-3 bacterium]
MEQALHSTLTASREKLHAERPAPKRPEMVVPMLDLRRQYEYLRPAIELRLRRALDHQHWILGPEVKELEQRVCHYIGTSHAVGCASGTDALVLALRAIALKLRGEEYLRREDEVITSSFTFTATGDAIIRAGATPVFCDIDPTTFNISARTVEPAITEKTVGIVPVHLYGQACPMDEIMAIARSHRLFVVEDVAQAFGAEWAGTRCGAWGDCGAFSFFPSKNLGGFGDGGMVTTSDAELAHYVDVLRRHGGKDKYNAEYIGYNSRLDTLQAAVLLAKMDSIEEFNARRKFIAECYSHELEGLNGISVPASSENGNHVFHQYTIRSQSRDQLAARLRECGVATMIYYPVPLHRMKLFAGRCRTAGELPEAERAAAEVLSLPIEPLLRPEELNHVVTSIRQSLN